MNKKSSFFTLTQTFDPPPLIFSPSSLPINFQFQYWHNVLCSSFFTQIQSSVLQPPPTEEHKQRVRSMMESLSLQAPAQSCSPGLPSNVLYPSREVKHTLKCTKHTRTQTYVYIMQAHALSPIRKLQLTPCKNLKHASARVVKATTHAHTHSQHTVSDTHIVLQMSAEHLHWFFF